MKNEKTELTAADLALYLDCKVMTPDGKGVLNSVTHDTGLCSVIMGEMGPDYDAVFNAGQIKPILRPLSDMTMGGKAELSKSFFIWKTKDNTY